MPKIDLPTAREHLRVEADEAQDALIETWLKAAYLAVEGKIFRRVHADTVPPEDLTGVVADEAINSAALLILGHLFANREAVAEGSRAPVPMGAEWLLQPYINYDGGA